MNTNQKDGAPSHRNVIAAVAVVTLAVALALMVGRAVRAGAAFAAGPSVAVESAGETRNRPLEGFDARDVAAPAGRRVSLGDVRSGLVMVFDTACGPCAVTMASWADLAREAGGRPVELIALTVEPARGAAEYWHGWSRVRVLAADTATLRNDLRLQATPTTLLVEDGVVRKSYVGPLSPTAKAELVLWIRHR